MTNRADCAAFKVKGDHSMFCTSCGSEVAGNGGVCGNCGATVGAGSGAAAAAMPMSSAAAGMPDNTAGALAYLTIIPAIIFLVSDGYNKRPFIRFHSFQSIFLGVACMVVSICLMVIPVVGWILEPILMLGFLVLWLITVFKAYNGKEFELPLIGGLARKQAEAS
jgi:uncharacterized membrane protein